MQAWLLVILVASSAVLAYSGVDVSALTTEFACIHQAGYDFAVVRGYESSGRVDPNAKASIQNAKAAGIPYVDVYLFPCVPCGNPASQATQLWDALKGDFGMVWLDIETQSWSSNQASNQAFITELASTLKSLGASVGVYSSYYNWESIVGLGWTGMAQYPLWYAHYDNNPSFSDFVAFGGWRSPHVKQYAGNVSLCGALVDLNWYPN